MSYQVLLDEAAESDLADLPPEWQERVMAGLVSLTDNPRPPTSKALSGPLRGLRRLRVNDYRAAYSVEESERVVTVWAVGHRRDFYRRLGRR